jgi:chromosomal replication initiation ATPase DnaA
MEKIDVKKLVFQAYNLSTQDKEPRLTNSLSEWFEKYYKAWLKEHESQEELVKILRVICEINDVDIVDVKGKSRNKELVTARREYCYFAYNVSKKSMKKIGAKINKDHATVLHHKNKMEGWLNIPGYNLKEKFELIENQLKI